MIKATLIKLSKGKRDYHVQRTGRDGRSVRSASDVSRDGKAAAKATVLAKPSPEGV